MVELKLHGQTVKIDEGELVGYEVDEYQYIHQKGSSGWRNADTEMFPIIGPTADANFLVQTPRDFAVQDQHGLLRELAYELKKSNGTTAVFEKEYKERSPVTNSKFPEKSNKQFLFYTYGFKFQKKFELKNEGLFITFTVSGERDTPFMLGYHPAFKLHSDTPVIVANGQEIDLDSVLEVGSRALQVPNCSEIILKDDRKLKIQTEGFGNFMLWTEVRNMVCIEPITFYPYAVEQQNLHEGFQYLKDEAQSFHVQISPIS